MKFIKINKFKCLLFGVFLYSVTLTLSAEPVKIMFLGDSITVGDARLPQSPEENQSKYKIDKTIPHIPFEKQLAYRGMLSWLLKKEGYAIAGSRNTTQIADYNISAHLDFVGSKSKNSNNYDSKDNNDSMFDEDHEGHTGFTSSKILEKIKEIKITPDIVLLHIGTNDGAGAIAIKDTVENVEKILDEIFKKNKNAKVLLARIIEARRVEKVSPIAWKTEVFNSAIANMVAKHKNKTQIKMVDMQNGARLIYNPCGTKSGDMQPFHEDENNTYAMHPNPKGYKKMGQKWFNALIDSRWLPDIKVPVIKLNGGNAPEIKLGISYKERGALVIDNHDNNLTATIDASKVDIKKVGTYKVSYNATDKAGNKAVEVIRTVTVTMNPDLSKDDDNNGLPDALEAGWFDYKKEKQTATLYPDGLLAIKKPLSATPSVDEHAITLIHVVDAGQQVYISAQNNRQVITGFKIGGDKYNTLAKGSLFSAGSEATIKKENDTVFIEIETPLAKDKTLTIGGK